MIYLGSSTDSRGCSSPLECARECDLYPERCRSPSEQTMTLKDGIWSSHRKHNPFASYFKVFLPSCGSDQFGGTRGPIPAGVTGTNLFFHGRHIFSSMLRHLVTYYNLHKARTVILVGSGTGATGVARNCDFLAESLATINSETVVKCVLDGPSDLTPSWLQQNLPPSAECSYSVSLK